MSESFGIALFGCGTVGGGVARLLLEQSERLAARAGRRLELRHVVVHDPDKARGVDIPRRLFSTPEAALADPGVHAVAELIGGVDWARQLVLDALAAGKHIVTANKAILSEHGQEIFETARRYHRAVAFEASVAGGVPIIAALSQSLAANQIVALQGILNGTSNFILAAMSDHGRTYAEALAEAQEHGYAEADPTLDVDGTDAAHKLAILAQIAFGANIRGSAIERRGIADVEAMDIRFAAELGYTLKLLAEGWLSENQVALHVAPVLLRHSTLLAQVPGADNAVRVEGDAVGDTLYYGPGAGRMPTASAVVADLIDLAIGRGSGLLRRSGYCRRIALARHRDRPREREPIYLRLLVADRPGALAEVAHALAAQEISIASVMQHEALEDGEGAVVPLVIMTHTAATDRFRAALAVIGRLPFVSGPGAYYPVAD